MLVQDKRILITGATGYIGRHFVESLKLTQDAFKVFIREKEKDFDKRNIFYGDITNFSKVNKAIAECDIVLHLACVPVGICKQNPELGYSVNVEGTKNVATSCAEQKKELIFVSSSEVYGHSSELPFKEESKVVPESVYGSQKYLAEKICLDLVKQKDLPLIIIRLFNVYGPSVDGSPRNTVETIFLRNALERKKLIINDSVTTKDFLYVDDAINAIWLTLRNSKNLNYSIFNIGSGVETSLVELAKKICKLTNCSFDDLVEINDDKSGGTRCVADTNLSFKCLNFKNKVPLELGLKLIQESLIK